MATPIKNDPKELHILRSLLEIFSALQLICIMDAGFKRIEPGLNQGIDLPQEYKTGERLARKEDMI